MNVSSLLYLKHNLVFTRACFFLQILSPKWWLWIYSKELVSVWSSISNYSSSPSRLWSFPTGYTFPASVYVYIMCSMLDSLHMYKCKCCLHVLRIPVAADTTSGVSMRFLPFEAFALISIQCKKINLLTLYYFFEWCESISVWGQTSQNLREMSEKCQNVSSPILHYTCKTCVRLMRNIHGCVIVLWCTKTPSPLGIAAQRQWEPSPDAWSFWKTSCGVNVWMASENLATTTGRTA